MAWHALCTSVFVSVGPTLPSHLELNTQPQIGGCLQHARAGCGLIAIARDRTAACEKCFVDNVDGRRVDANVESVAARRRLQQKAPAALLRREPHDLAGPRPAGACQRVDLDGRRVAACCLAEALLVAGNELSYGRTAGEERLTGTIR